MSDKINNNNNKKGKIYQFYELSKENIKSDNYLVNKNQKKTFLTNISPNINIVDYRMKLKELKGLKEKQNSLIKKINSVKNKKNEMNEISFNNIYKSKVDNNMIYYAGHTNSAFDKPLSEGIGNDTVFIVRIRDDA